MSGMYKINGPISLTENQIVGLHEKLRKMRHDVNGRLANIVAAAELMRLDRRAPPSASRFCWINRIRRPIPSPSFPANSRNCLA